MRGNRTRCRRAPLRGVRLSGIGMPANARVLRPNGSVTRTAALTCVAVVTPLFGALYVLTVPEGTWLRVLVVHLLVTLGCAAATVGLCRSRVWVAAPGVVMRSPLGIRRSLERDRIRELLLVRTYRGGTLETHSQLFVVTHSGRTAMRMRGWMWSRESMRRIAQELDLPLTAVHEAMTPGELRRTHPDLLPPLERRRIVLAAAVGVAAALAALIAAALLGAVGLPGPVTL